MNILSAEIEAWLKAFLRAGLNDGLSKKRQTIVTLPSILSAVCIAQN